LSSLVPQAELETDELNELVAAAAAKNGKIGPRVILARLKTERIQREQAAMRAAHKEETLADRRLLAPLPPPDGALTKVVELVDETLTADKSEEPPMRDASGPLSRSASASRGGCISLSPPAPMPSRCRRVNRHCRRCRSLC